MLNEKLSLLPQESVDATINTFNQHKSFRKLDFMMCLADSCYETLVELLSSSSHLEKDLTPSYIETIRE